MPIGENRCGNVFISLSLTVKLIHKHGSPSFSSHKKPLSGGGNKYTSTTISEKRSKQGGRISDENRWLSLSLCVYIQFRRRSRSCDAVVVHWWSVETTPFDDAVAHSINQSGAPSSASALKVMHPRNFWSVDSNPVIPPPPQTPPPLPSV